MDVRIKCITYLSLVIASYYASITLVHVVSRITEQLAKVLQ